MIFNVCTSFRVNVHVLFVECVVKRPRIRLTNITIVITNLLLLFNQFDHVRMTCMVKCQLLTKVDTKQMYKNCKSHALHTWILPNYFV